MLDFTDMTVLGVKKGFVVVCSVQKISQEMVKVLLMWVFPQ